MLDYKSRKNELHNELTLFTRMQVSCFRLLVLHFLVLDIHL